MLLQQQSGYRDVFLYNSVPEEIIKFLASKPSALPRIARHAIWGLQPILRVVSKSHTLWNSNHEHEEKHGY
jgi:hypothetical protein